VKSTRRPWLMVGGLSLAIHALLGWALLIGVPVAPALVEPRSVVVNLMSPPTPERSAPRETAAATSALRPPAVRAPPGVPNLSVPGPAPSSGGEIVAPPGFTARGTLTGGGEALRQAARKSGCTQADIVKLTKAEREACAEALGAKHKNGPALYAAVDPDKKAAFDGDCRKDDDWCLYRAGKGPYPGLFALGKKRKIKGWE